MENLKTYDEHLNENKITKKEFIKKYYSQYLEFCEVNGYEEDSESETEFYDYHVDSYEENGK